MPASAEILAHARAFVKQELARDSSGHDWWHISRVTHTTLEIARHENADLFVCELAALLHDIADEKLNASKAAGMQKVKSWLEENQVPEKAAAHVLEIISTMSYNGGHNQPMKTLEGKVVQDADRLDALGAIGIARTFAYGGHKGHLMHNPALAVRAEMTPEEYRNAESTPINHFYEKLLKLKNLMNTAYGKKLAAERHAYMENFLEQFYQEWEGKR
ncbi:HD domain-containing protein [Adhaeribacter sp. BT258]|uniref:HD domain-containing protein n=1 Tax=Adhaeribacter terrigena TaxID=2793070 RepID=A0ABS1C6D1_9BACT|nr:HD domain-containing protein [Adhaeribacter terrigena]MBK0404936.1 HD domain-containing protein [Adhaeribacter terrigena]